MSSVEWERGVAKMTVPESQLWWQEQWKEIFNNPTPPYKKRLMCSHVGYITSPKAAFFSSPRQCYETRQRAYAMHDIPVSLAHPPKPPFKVVLLQRGNTRGIQDIDKMREVVESYGVPVEVVEFGGGDTLKRQLEVLSSAGVFVLVHGAGGSSIPFLPYHAAVIEIYPFMWAPTMYKLIAGVCGNLHHPIHLWKHGHIHYHDPEKKIECEAKSRRDTTGEDGCALAYKNTAVVMDLERFEVVLVEALQDIGYPIRPKTIK